MMFGKILSTTLNNDSTTQIVIPIGSSTTRPCKKDCNNLLKMLLVAALRVSELNSIACNL
jgi:hypothetical protein